MHTQTHMLPKPAVTAVSNTPGGHMPSCPDSDILTYKHKAPTALTVSVALLICLNTYIIKEV